MIFSTGLKKIYESIGSQGKAKQEELLNELHAKIAASKALSHKFEILDLVKENAGMFTEGQAKKFFAKLNEKHNGFLKENKEVAIFYKEEKKLFEFFNVNQKEVVSEKLDLIVNKKDNELNESIILEYVTNKRFVSLQEAMATIKPRLKEHFSQIKATNNEAAFEESIDRLKFNAELLEGEKKKMVKAAIQAVYSESFDNFSSAVEKTYKLALLTEKFLKEYSDDEDEFDSAEKMPKGRTVKLPDLSFLKGVTLEIPKDFETDYVRFEFYVTIHHTEKTAYNIGVELEQLIPQLNKLRRPFVKAVMAHSNGLFDPNNMDFQMNHLRTTNVKPGQTYDASFGITCFVNDKANQKFFPLVDKGAQKGQRDLIAGYTQAAYAVLKAFDAYLPTNDTVSPYITDEAMKAALADSTGGRSKEYVRRAGTKYQQADNRRVSDDSWLDQAIFRGDTRAENGEEEIADDFSHIDSGSGIMPGELGNVEDDEIDQQAVAQAKPRIKPTLTRKVA